MMNDLLPLRWLRQRLDTGLSDAEGVFNQLTDSQRQWWPFGFLQPAPHERFSTWRAAALAALQGLPLGFGLIAIDGHARRAATEQHLVSFLLVVCVTMFVTNRFTLAYFWNRRAERLARHRARLEAWKTGG